MSCRPSGGAEFVQVSHDSAAARESPTPASPCHVCASLSGSQIGDAPCCWKVGPDRLKELVVTRHQPQSCIFPLNPPPLASTVLDIPNRTNNARSQLPIPQTQTGRNSSTVTQHGWRHNTRQKDPAAACGLPRCGPAQQRGRATASKTYNIIAHIKRRLVAMGFKRVSHSAPPTTTTDHTTVVDSQGTPSPSPDAQQ